MTPSNKVLTNQTQNLSENEKVIARNNIGADSIKGFVECYRTFNDSAEGDKWFKICELEPGMSDSYSYMYELSMKMISTNNGSGNNPAECATLNISFDGTPRVNTGRTEATWEDAGILSAAWSSHAVGTHAEEVIKGIKVFRHRYSDDYGPFDKVEIWLCLSHYFTSMSRMRVEALINSGSRTMRSYYTSPTAYNLPWKFSNGNLAGTSTDPENETDHPSPSGYGKEGWEHWWYPSCPKTVMVDRAQDFTDTEKAQAKRNIEASGIVYSIARTGSVKAKVATISYPYPQNNRKISLTGNLNDGTTESTFQLGIITPDPEGNDRVDDNVNYYHILGVTDGQMHVDWMKPPFANIETYEMPTTINDEPAPSIDMNNSLFIAFETSMARARAFIVSVSYRYAQGSMDEPNNLEFLLDTNPYYDYDESSTIVNLRPRFLAGNSGLIGEEYSYSGVKVWEYIDRTDEDNPKALVVLEIGKSTSGYGGSYADVSILNLNSNRRIQLATYLGSPIIPDEEEEEPAQYIPSWVHGRTLFTQISRSVDWNDIINKPELPKCTGDRKDSSNGKLITPEEISQGYFYVQLGLFPVPRRADMLSFIGDLLGFRCIRSNSAYGITSSYASSIEIFLTDENGRPMIQSVTNLLTPIRKIDASEFELSDHNGSDGKTGSSISRFHFQHIGCSASNIQSHSTLAYGLTLRVNLPSGTSFQANDRFQYAYRLVQLD